MTMYKGIEAIEYAEENGLTLSKYNDPTEDARDGVSTEEARRIAQEDPSLIYLPVDLVRVWVANQPDGIGHDGTEDYLRAAKVSYTQHNGSLMPWSDFAAARAAVAAIGHGTDNEGDAIDGEPDLVACQPDADGATETVQHMDSRNGVEPR